MSNRVVLPLVLAASVLMPVARADAGDRSLPETVLITIDQVYEYRKPTRPDFHELAGFELPLLDYVEDMLYAADIEPLDAASAGPVPELSISLRGLALGRLYIEQGRSYLYSGADLRGEIEIIGPGGVEGATTFSSVIERPFDVLINHGYEHPANAPFLKALVRPDGFIEALCRAMIEAWGVASVLPSLEEPSDAIRYSVVSVLGIVGDPVAGPGLAAALEDEHERVRWEAAWSLGLIGDTSAVPALIEALLDSSQDVRWFASWSLRTITGEDMGPDHDLWTAWWNDQDKGAGS